jgi:PIN domain nuclease of toxin-antitoxin system
MLPEHPKDPADRIIFSSALEQKAQLMSADKRFRDYQELTGLLIQM